MIKVLFAPSIPWRFAAKKGSDEPGPDFKKIYDCLAEEGIESYFYDPHGKPWNLFAGKDTLLQSIDPLRALDVVLRKRKFDVVVSVFEGAATSIGALRTITRFPPALAVWDIGLTNWRLRNRVINFTLPRVDQLFVLGKNQIPYIKESYKGEPVISSIGHYVDTEFFSPQALKMDGHILSVGEDIGRDFKTLVEASRGMERKVLIKASKVVLEEASSNVEAIRERISFSQLRGLYAESSIVVVPSTETQNACGVSTILEAAAMGRPLIVSDNPGIYDFIVPNETCIVVPPRNPQALHDAMARLLNDMDECERLANNARIFAVEKCSAKVFASRFGQELKKLAESHSLRTANKAGRIFS
jgi:glycosyltransferase involved in cell wall biosynthesis